MLSERGEHFDPENADVFGQNLEAFGAIRERLHGI